jgi:urease accessory protein
MPFDAPQPGSGWHASLSLGFERRGGRTVLARRRHDGPLVVQKALHPEGEGICHAIVVHPPSGLVGGDALALDVDVGAGAAALLTTPGAGKWYRSTGRFASQTVRFNVARDACLEWLPQENILYDGALARCRWSAELAPGARLIAWDIYCLGRTASGESFRAGECNLESTIRREGRLAWIERGTLRPGSREMQSAAALRSWPVFGTLLLAAPEIESAWVAAAREVAAPDGGAGVTALPGLLLARCRASGTEAAHRYFRSVWTSLRPAVMGRDPVAPRIWST